MRELNEQLVTLDERIRRADHLFKRVFAENDLCQKLTKVEGIGPVVATALVAAAGKATVFASGRHLAAWLGLVPRQHISGGKERLLGISKRGDCYVRSLLIHSARASVYRTAGKNDPRSQWITRLSQRRGKNIAAVALANKNAHIAWVLLTRDEGYRAAA